MANLLSRVTLQLRKLFAKRIRVVTSLCLDPQPFNYPYHANDKIFCHSEFRPDSQFREGPDGPRRFYPLVGMLIVDRDSRLAVFSSRASESALIQYLEGAVTTLTNSPTVLDEDDCIIYTVLSNGHLCTPRTGADIQNYIRLVMEREQRWPVERRTDYYIGGTIDHNLMTSYAQAYLPRKYFHIDD